ncbi:MAG: hypothetical protein IKI19_08495 [Prevotella sp.]|nr:hypothetical protein [Prevotella sp.]
MKTKRILGLLMALAFSVSVSAYYPFFAYGSESNYKSGIYDIAHDGDNIYVAKQGGLVVINKATGAKTVYQNGEGLLSADPISLGCHNGDLWVGTADGKLLNWSREKELSPGGNPISNIVFAPNNRVYVCMGTTGVIVDLEGFCAISNFGGDYYGGFPSMFIDTNGTAWIGRWRTIPTTMSLVKYNEQDGAHYMFKENDQLPRAWVYSLAADDEGGVWYSTADGRLIRLLNDEVSTICECENFGYDMAFDSQQQLWMACANGPLLKMNDGEYTTYPCEFESRRWSCLDIDDEAIYVGTDAILLKFEDGIFSVIDVELEVTTGVNTAKQDAATGREPMFDLQGRRLSGKPQHGAYIKDRRKQVVR